MRKSPFIMSVALTIGFASCVTPQPPEEKGQRVVPGPHGACELPETLDELRRILHLHLKSEGKNLY